jgi:hypothetical protein
MSTTVTTGHVGRLVWLGQTALGSSQTTALPLPKKSAFVELTTVASSTGVLLPATASVPCEIIVQNAGANTLSVYPPAGGTVAGGSTNAAYSISAGNGAIFELASPGVWYAFAASSGGGLATPVSVANGGTGLATLTAHNVLLGEGTSNVAIAAPGTTGRPLLDQGGSADPAFGSTGVKIDSSFGAITADTDGATVTFNLSTSNKHTVTLGGNRTLALSNATVGQQFTITLVQDGTGSRTVTWFSTIKWPNATPPPLTTTAAGIDVFTFLCVASNQYYGFTAGQAMG